MVYADNTVLVGKFGKITEEDKVVLIDIINAKNPAYNVIGKPCVRLKAKDSAWAELYTFDTSTLTGGEELPVESDSLVYRMYNTDVDNTDVDYYGKFCTGRATKSDIANEVLDQVTS